MKWPWTRQAEADKHLEALTGKEERVEKLVQEAQTFKRENRLGPRVAYALRKAGR